MLLVLHTIVVVMLMVLLRAKLSLLIVHHEVLLAVANPQRFGDFVPRVGRFVALHNHVGLLLRKLVVVLLLGLTVSRVNAALLTPCSV